MKYDNTDVRRQDRLLDEKDAVELLKCGEYGFLSLSGSEDCGGGYGIPVSYAFDGDDLWFHCAPEGEKLRRIARCDRASFCVVGRTHVLPDKFSTLYESVIAFGRIEMVDDTDVKRRALALLVRKYAPEYVEKGEKYAEHSLPRTAILRFRIDTFSGKAKRSTVLPAL